MSLVRSVELPAASYRNPNLYSSKGSNDSSDFSTQSFGSDKRKTSYAGESYSTESYEKYFLNSPSDSGVSGNSSCNLQETSTQNPSNASFVLARRPDSYQSNFDSDCLESQSSDQGDFDEDTMRLKLQELERALLDDNDDEDDDSMEVDGEWVDPVKNALLQDSPKESTSSDSNSNSNSNQCRISSSNKEISQVPSRTPKKLLIDCAEAISEGNMEEASIMINNLRQIVSIQGEPSQRIAAYMVEGLVARMAASGKFLYKALKCKEPPSSDRLAAMQILFEVCPCFKFGFMTANGAIIEAFKDEKRVHIVDFDINQGSQYMTLIQTIASRTSKPPYLRLTGVDDPESVQRSVGGLKIIGQRLEKLAEALGVPFEFQAVPSRASLVTPSMLDCRPGEALIVNFAFQLHHMPDESVSTVNQRDQLLRMVKSLNPKLVTVVEQDVNTNTAPFFPRFVEAYSYYSAVFESLDATLPRDSQDRANVERQCLARDIVNVVACEGEERIERYEVAGKWRARMTMAGFTTCPMSVNVVDAIRKLNKQYCDKYKIKEEMGALHFGWQDKNLIVASAWR